MKRFASLLFVAAVACVSVLSYAIAAAERITRPVYERFKAAAIKVFSGPVKMDRTAELAPRALIVAARTFTARILKRERPVLSASWRMCPSI